MNSFAKIVDGDGDQLIINLNNVTVIRPDVEDEDSTAIYFIDGGELKVKISFSEIERTIRKQAVAEYVLRGS